MVSQQLHDIITFLRASGTSIGGGPTADIARVRTTFEAAGQFFTPPADVAEQPIEIGGVPGVEFTPEGSTGNAGAILYLHGGGYCIGSPTTHRGLIGHLVSRTGIRAVAPDYRLAPEHPFPAAVDDALNAYRALVAGGADPAHIAVAGDSAGGGLSLALLLALRRGNEPLPACAVLLSPWTDLELSGATLTTRAAVDPLIHPQSMPEGVERYLQGANPRDPLASPLYGDLSGLPPMLIQVGDAEVLLDDSVRFAERARAMDVDVTLEVWPEMIHVWQFFAGSVPESDEGVAKIASFIVEHVGG